MSDYTTPFPTVQSAVLGDVVLRADDKAPWISLVPAHLWPSRSNSGPLEVYLAGGSLAPDAGCLQLAEQTVLKLSLIEPRCQSALALDPGQNPEQEFFLMWLNFVLQQDVATAEAVFTLSSANVLHDDTYSLWIVTLSDGQPLGVRREYW